MRLIAKTCRSNRFHLFFAHYTGVVRGAVVPELQQDRERAASFGQAARHTVETTYDLDTCVTRQLALMDFVASGSISG